MKRKDFEVMAPVGSYESLEAALQAGANSVYFGVEGLNMRSRSPQSVNSGALPTAPIMTSSAIRRHPARI